MASELPLLRITSGYFCAGLELGGRAAPILRYMRGWSLEHIRAYCHSKVWTLEVLHG